MLRQWDLCVIYPDAAVVVSELVTNALCYGARVAAPPPDSDRGPVDLTLWQRASYLICVVADGSPEPPVLQPVDPTAEAGRGLQVVQALSSSWGWTMLGGRQKAVWAALSLVGSRGGPAWPRPRTRPCYRSSPGRDRPGEPGGRAAARAGQAARTVGGQAAGRLPAYRGDCRGGRGLRPAPALAARAVSPSARRALAGPERGPVPGDDDLRHAQDPLPAGPQHLAVRRERVVGPPLGAPPGVRAHVDAVRGRRQRADVLGGVPGGADQLDRRAQLGPLGVPVGPLVVQVDGPVVVDPGRREQRGVDRVVRVVMAEHQIGDVAGPVPCPASAASSRSREGTMPGSTMITASPSTMRVTVLATALLSPASRA